MFPLESGPHRKFRNPLGTTDDDSPAIELASRAGVQQNARGCHRQREAGYVVDSIVRAFPPLNDPIERHAHVVGKGRLDVRVNVDEVNWAWAGGGQDAKIIALWKQWIEGTQSLGVWIVAARNIRLGAEARGLPRRKEFMPLFRSTKVRTCFPQ